MLFVNNERACTLSYRVRSIGCDQQGMNRYNVYVCIGNVMAYQLSVTTLPPPPLWGVIND